MSDPWSDDVEVLDAETATRMREGIELAARVAAIAVGNYEMQHYAELSRCTPAAQSALLARVAVTYLVGHGLISVAPEAEWERWLPTGVPEPLDTDLRAALDEGLAELARINAALPRR